MRLLPDDKHLGWTPYAWLIYIVPFALSPLYVRHATWPPYVITTLAFVALYLRSHWSRGRELILLASATAALGIAFVPLAPAAGAFFVYAGAMLGVLEPTRRAVTGVLVIALLATVEAAFMRRDLFSSSWAVVFTLLVGAINIHYAQVGRSNARLRLAHEEIEHLAKVAERERIARDLHDLLGHTLSLVILKSELASKLSDRDPARARDEIRDVERIARDALTEVRAAVAGYRAGGLAAEVQRARTALASAGVAIDAQITKTQLPPSHEAVLCLALREAITNIVRHAGAQNCTVHVSTTASGCIMTITDDGRGGNAAFGSGLSGMRERLELLGGSVTRDGRHGTKLTVTLPMQESAERSA